MAEDFQVGDVVVCVNDSPCTATGEPKPVPCPWKRGEIGRVVSISACRYGLELAPQKHRLLYIAAYRFRKLPKADEQFTERMRKCKPHRNQVPA